MPTFYDADSSALPRQAATYLPPAAPPPSSTDERQHVHRRIFLDGTPALSKSRTDAHPMMPPARYDCLHMYVSCRASTSSYRRTTSSRHLADARYLPVSRSLSVHRSRAHSPSRCRSHHFRTHVFTRTCRPARPPACHLLYILHTPPRTGLSAPVLPGRRIHPSCDAARP